MRLLLSLLLGVVVAQDISYTLYYRYNDGTYAAPQDLSIDIYDPSYTFADLHSRMTRDLFYMYHPLGLAINITAVPDIDITLPVLELYRQGATVGVLYLAHQVFRTTLQHPHTRSTVGGDRALRSAL